MLLPQLATVFFFLVTTKGQEENNKKCDVDTDLIFFENEDLEKLREMFKFGGDCSSAIWKGEFNNAVQNQLRSGRKIRALSDHDQRMLNNLLSQVNQRTIDDRKRSTSEPFGSESERFQFQEPPDRFYESEKQRTYQEQIYPQNTGQRHNSQRSPRLQDRPDDFFRPNGLVRPDNEDGFYFPNNQRGTQSQGRPEEFFGPNVQRRPHNEQDFFSSNSQRRPNSQRPNGQWGPQNEVDSFSSQRRPQNEGESENFFRPNDQRRPQNGGDFFSTNNQRRPQSQGRPEDFFRPVDEIRPQFDVPTDNIFVSGNQRRPHNVGGINDIFINPNQIVTQRVQTTTRRPETTTLPGPPTWATPPSRCVSRCPNTPEYNPVCGTDSVTYTNPGRLRCEQRCGKAHVVVNHYGTCTTTTAAPTTSTTPSTTPFSNK